MIGHQVCDAVPGAQSRRATRADQVMFHNGADDTYHIPDYVTVVECCGHLWLKSDRLRGWAGIHANDTVVHNAIRAAMARQGRDIPVWSQADADASRDAELAHWQRVDAPYQGNAQT